MSRWEGKYIIGLTGNIAVGKSVVRKMLQHLGAYTIDADDLTHQVMAPGAPAYKPVVEMFGKFILDDQEKINRQLLGAVVFSVPEALVKLESIVHPIVNQFVGMLISRAKQKVIVVEAIKLLESSLANDLDAVWVVDASPDVQIKRLMETRKMTLEEARRRMAAQPPQAEKLARATAVIQNNGSVDETWKQVQSAWNDMVRKMNAPKTEAPRSNTAPLPAAPTQGTVVRPPAAAAPQQGNTGRLPGTPPTVRPVTQAAPAAPTIELNVRRGMPNNAEAIARFISRLTGRSVTRMDIMIAFGQKSYLLSEDKSTGSIVGLIGWQVENLITRVDEFYIDPAAPRDPVVKSLLSAMEDAAANLQSEVSFVFLPGSTASEVIQSLLNNGYQPLKLEEVKFPAWREAAQEMSKSGSQGLMKQLRADRIMKPI